MSATTKPDLGKMIDQEEKQFLAYYDEMIRDLTEEDYGRTDLYGLAEHFEKSLRYNVPLGRKRRAMFAIFIYRYYKREITPRDLEITRVAAWAIELLQGCFLVADDLVDNSITRRGQRCWAKVLRDRNHAMNDVYHIEASAFLLLDKHLKEEDFYVDLIKDMRSLVQITLIGQYYDLLYACPKDVDFTHFNRKTYNRTCMYKTSLYTFYLPAAMGMIMAGVKEKACYDEAKAMLMRMGEYFQIQDDLLDCFGDADVIGKIGTDIQDNKCTWLIVTALEDCSQEQLQVLKDNYGRWDDEKVKRVKDVYRDLDIEGKFRHYEETIYQELLSLMKAMDPKKLPVPIFKVFLDKLFQRKH